MAAVVGATDRATIRFYGLSMLKNGLLNTAIPARSTTTVAAARSTAAAARSTAARAAIVGLVAAVGGLAAAGPAAAAASASKPKAPTTCAKQKTQVAASLGARAYVKGGSLFICVPGVKAKNAGPWTKGMSQISMYGPSVVWTQRSEAQGLTLDRVWAFAYGRTWLKGVPPTKGAGSDVDIEVRSLRARGMVAAWATGGGQLVQATDYAGAEKPQKGGGSTISTTVDREVGPLGAGTPGAAAPSAAPTDPVAASLFAVQPTGGLLTKTNNVNIQTVGRWPAYAGAALASTLRLDLLDDGDADDCGGARSYGVTVNPVAGAPAVGWRTSFRWQTSPC